jgi:phage-related protein
MLKVITWIMANGATLLGLLQAIVKAVKELLTGVVNLISLILPQSTANKAVEAVRGVLNAIDDVIEKIKGYLLK